MSNPSRARTGPAAAPPRSITRWPAGPPQNSNEPYTNLPYILDAGGGCGEDILQSQYDGFSIVGGHEYAETVTDPFPVSGWWDGNDPFGGEIGDKCAWNDPVTGKIDISAVTLSTGSFAMQPLYDNNALANGGDGCVIKPVGAVKGFRGLCLDNNAGVSVKRQPRGHLAVHRRLAPAVDAAAR